MSDETSDLDEVFDFLAEERNRRDPEEHPSPETLTAYQADELSPEEDEKVQDHLAVCRHCTEMLLELEEFLRPLEEPEPAAALETEDRHRMPGPLPAPTETVPQKRIMFPLIASLIGVLILLGGYLTRRAIQLQQRVTELQSQVAELQEPVVSPPTIPLRSTRGEDVIEVPAGRAVDLTMDAPEPEKYSEYRAHVLDEKGRKLWDVSLSKDKDGKLRFILLQGPLTPGDYTIRLYGTSPGSFELLQENRIRVPSNSPGSRER